MAKKVINVVYKVDSRELDAVKKSLQLNAEQAKKFDDSLKKVGTSAKDVAKDAGKSFIDFKNILGTITFVGVISGLTSLGKKIFDLGVQQEQLNIAFTTFLGSAEKAKKLMAELTKFSIITPFTPDQVNKAAKTLLAFGTQAKDIIPTLKMIGDVSAGTGKDLAEMAVIFGQIQSTGRLMGQDLLQLINAGFNPLQVISEKTGKSVKVLKEEMEKGLISFDMVKQAFKDATSEGGLFFNLMENQSATVGGKLSTVAGNIEEIGKNLYGTASGPLAMAVDVLVKISEELMKISEPLEMQFKKAFDEFGKDSEEFKKVYDEALTKLGPERVTELILEAKAESSLAFTSAIDDQKKLNQTLEDWIRIKEQQLDIERKARKGGTNDRLEEIELLKLQIGLAKTKLADVQAGMGAGKEGYKGKDIKIHEETLAEKTARENADVARAMKDANEIINKEWAETLDEAKQTMDISNQRKLDDLQIQKDRENAINDEARQRELDAEKKAEEEKKALKQATFDFGVNLLGALLLSSMQTNNNELADLDSKYQRELELAGNNEQAKKNIEARREQERKQLMIKQQQDERTNRQKAILAETLVNAVKALGLPPIPGANFIAAAQATAFGLLQAGLVGKYKEGGWITGPGTPTSDSVPIMASRDEFMVNAAAAAQSPNLLEAINNREINDSILRAVATSGGRQVNVFDDSRIVKAIQENQVDYMNHGYTLMKVEKKGANFKRYIRSKVQGY